MSELGGDVRALTVRGVVLAVNDGTALQTADVQTHDGVVRSELEVATPYGFSSVPPSGANAVLVAIGADPGDMMVLALWHPGARLGGLAPGESALWDAGGNRVAVRQGGTVEVVAATSVRLVVQGTTLEATAAGVTITGPVTIKGDARITGALTVDGAIHGTADAADVAHAMG
jgi:phage gp45-like